jgi:hypothetical protein
MDGSTSTRIPIQATAGVGALQLEASWALAGHVAACLCLDRLVYFRNGRKASPVED